eukprot:ANDGO_07159.mRNA.1 hypothetical protein
MMVDRKRKVRLDVDFLADQVSALQSRFASMRKMSEVNNIIDVFSKDEHQLEHRQESVATAVLPDLAAGESLPAEEMALPERRKAAERIKAKTEQLMNFNGLAAAKEFIELRDVDMWMASKAESFWEEETVSQTIGDRLVASSHLDTSKIQFIITKMSEVMHKMQGALVEFSNSKSSQSMFLTLTEHLNSARTTVLQLEEEKARLQQGIKDLDFRLDRQMTEFRKQAEQIVDMQIKTKQQAAFAKDQTSKQMSQFRQVIAGKEARILELERLGASNQESRTQFNAVYRWRGHMLQNQRTLIQVLRSDSKDKAQKIDDLFRVRRVLEMDVEKYRCQWGIAIKNAEDLDEELKRTEKEVGTLRKVVEDQNNAQEMLVSKISDLENYISGMRKETRDVGTYSRILMINRGTKRDADDEIFGGTASQTDISGLQTGLQTTVVTKTIAPAPRQHHASSQPKETVVGKYASQPENAIASETEAKALMHTSLPKEQADFGIQVSLPISAPLKHEETPPKAKKEASEESQNKETHSAAKKEANKKLLEKKNTAEQVQRQQPTEQAKGSDSLTNSSGTAAQHAAELKELEDKWKVAYMQLLTSTRAKGRKMYQAMQSIAKGAGSSGSAAAAESATTAFEALWKDFSDASLDAEKTLQSWTGSSKNEQLASKNTAQIVRPEIVELTSKLEFLQEALHEQKNKVQFMESEVVRFRDARQSLEIENDSLQKRLAQYASQMGQDIAWKNTADGSTGMDPVETKHDSVQTDELDTTKKFLYKWSVSLTELLPEVLRDLNKYRAAEGSMSHDSNFQIINFDEWLEFRCLPTLREYIQQEHDTVAVVERHVRFVTDDMSPSAGAEEEHRRALLMQSSKEELEAERASDMKATSEKPVHNAVDLDDFADAATFEVIQQKLETMSPGNPMNRALVRMAVYSSRSKRKLDDLKQKMKERAERSFAAFLSNVEEKRGEADEDSMLRILQNSMHQTRRNTHKTNGDSGHGRLVKWRRAPDHEAWIESETSVFQNTTIYRHSRSWKETHIGRCKTVYCVNSLVEEADPWIPCSRNA